MSSKTYPEGEGVVILKADERARVTQVCEQASSKSKHHKDALAALRDLMAD